MTRLTCTQLTRIVATSAVLTTLALAGCGSDDDSNSGATDSTADQTVVATSTTTVATTIADPATTAAADATNPTTADSSTPGQALAALSVLTEQELPGWTVQPEPPEDDSATPTFDQPECAQLQALESDPALEDDASATLVSPDGNTTLTENVTIGDPAAIERAFQTFAAPEVAACLQIVFTTILQAPGALPEGATVGAVQLAQQPLQAGDEAVGYVGTVVLDGGTTGNSATIGIRVDSVRVGGAVAVVYTTSAPLAEPVDPNMIASLAAQRITANALS